ncbi:MAG: DUF4124 domain-containing protein [Gammaproteobacteria bacterium]|nr:DUF4124 domain-containing protein [Gammaproteobacteria bacterium]
MQIRAAWAIVGGVLLGGALAWWLSRESPDEAAAKRERAEHAAAAMAEDARPVLYRWRDARGVLQITAQPPSGPDAGRRFEKVDMQPRTGIQVDGTRD